MTQPRGREAIYGHHKALDELIGHLEDCLYDRRTPSKKDWENYIDKVWSLRRFAAITIAKGDEVGLNAYGLKQLVGLARAAPRIIAEVLLSEIARIQADASVSAAMELWAMRPRNNQAYDSLEEAPAWPAPSRWDAFFRFVAPVRNHEQLDNVVEKHASERIQRHGKSYAYWWYVRQGGGIAIRSLWRSLVALLFEELIRRWKH